MNKFLINIKGDKPLWVVFILLASFSFLPVYSSASNLAYLYGDGNTFSYLFKHFIHLSLGFFLMYMVHKIPYRYFRGISILMIPVILVLLAYTIFQPSISDSITNSNRWIRIPIVGFGFQPSTLASIIILIYVARYLSKIKDKLITFSQSILPLWGPVFLTISLILPANFSTSAILFSMVMLLCFLGGYPLKYLMGILFSAVILFSIFILSVKAYPDLFPNRVDTWKSRVENFVDSKETKSNYQIEKAKIAIATGGITGLGPGKSVQKNFLPQSSSDFIYAIIVEEYGLIGGLALLLLYLWFLFRVIIISNKSKSVFGSLLAIALGIPIVFKALVNMAVAVQLFPVTGQPLPLISSGGTSIWMTCLAIGIIQSVRIGSEINEDETDENNPLEILKETI
ncbi:MAG: FtsW/RodA/SpoVE family cell cycle protein [Flavobacteriaceae bacterium]|jgi:cell division protein FtsW|nr:FtsW/RodA/SpoVE family cell cycle protein [Flavobacteriaceae bacterium]MBT3796913.1 FtsW/RodA/SpoVE family cell cycle protein [Candidatus Neomarinimicrobiota bacterium]MBT4113213.1 FtsW/RodA/SpoVE family cell cycle protein [Flavobacteriaceae bacterium]MBT5771382.1 FtsW/RodA/SpoVE family cell cycle protein [Flavobacteriaceae bacterium]